MDKTNLKSFLHGSAASMIGVGVLGIMNYFIRRILSLNLSEIDYGFFYSAFALVSIILVFLDLGLGQSVTILISKSFAKNNLQESKKIFTITFFVKLLLALTAFAVMEVLAPYLNRYYFEYPGSSTFLILIFLLIPAQALESSFLCIFTARKAFVTHNILMNIKVFIILAGVFFCAKAYGIEYCISWFVIASIIVAVLSFFIVKRYGISLLPFKTVKFNDLKSIFALSSWIAISTAAISVMYSMDTICLTWLEGLKSVAMYNIALPIMQIAQSFFVFPAIFTPFVAEMWQKKDYAGIKRTCYIGSLLMLLTLPVFILVGVYFSSDIISLLFDEKYIAAAPAVTILWSGMVFFSIASFNISALNSGGNQKNVAYMVLSCVVVNFVLNVILIPQFNYIGAALATAITYIIMALASIIILIMAFNKKITVNNVQGT
ncbi:MAG: flippase [Victivallaceae bacterium]|nr:flippase [Victivallaceae bacterium]